MMMMSILGKKPQNSPGNNSGRIETIVGPDTELRGEIKSGGNIRIDGLFEGQITSKGSLFIGKEGQIFGNIIAQNMVLSGKVQGNVSVIDKVEILSGGQLFGDIKARQLVIAEGVIFEGSCDMGTGGKRLAPVEVISDDKVEYDFTKKKIEMKKVPCIKAE